MCQFYQDSWLQLVDAIASLIEHDPQFVFDALDGRKSTAQINSATPETNINYRDEPVAFFFVLFGIVIEALTDRSNKQGDTLKILLALKKILSRSVAGTAIFQDAVFSETIELFDRLALTEGLAAQNVLVDIAKQLCITHPSAIEEDTSSDLSDDIQQLFELAKIIVVVLTNALPRIADPKSVPREYFTNETVTLIRNGFEALVEASAIFPSVIKRDLYASILHVFATILSTPACQDAVVAQCLPIFKRFIQRIAQDDGVVGSSSLAAQYTSFLQRLLAILKVAQRRDHESSLACAKNTLLTISIFLTSASSTILPDEPLIQVALEAQLDCLQDLGLAKVGAGCLRSLLLTTSKNETDEAVATYLFPRLVGFVTDIQRPDPENTRTPIAQALTAFAALHAQNEDRAATVMSIVLPTLLHRARLGGKEVFPELATRLLELAKGTLLPVFRGLVAAMEPDMKGFMEEVIREGSGGERGAGRGDGDMGTGGSNEPSIALKFNFGGR